MNTFMTFAIELPLSIVLWLLAIVLVIFTVAIVKAFWEDFK